MLPIYQCGPLISSQTLPSTRRGPSSTDCSPLQIRYVFIFHSCHFSFFSCVPLCLPAAHCTNIQSFIRALRALRHPEDESATQSHDLARSALCLSTVIDIPPEETDWEADEFEKDYARRYRTHMRETSTIPTLGTTLEEGGWRCLDEGQDQGGMTANAPVPTQPPSIDVVCHI
jgi:hypothetical protein